jgi:hypothetical protein
VEVQSLPGQIVLETYLENTQHKKGLAEWFKWYSACFANTSTCLQALIPPKKKMQKLGFFGKKLWRPHPNKRMW